MEDKINLSDNIFENVRQTMKIENMDVTGYSESVIKNYLNGSITDSAEMTSYLMAHLSGLAIFGLYFLVIMALVIGGIVVMAVNAKKMTFLPATTPIGKGQTFKVVVCNVGMASFFLIWLVFIIYATLR